MTKNNFQPLRPYEGTAGSIMVTCKATGRRAQWNKAALEGWQADLNGKPFDAYYSPEGIQQLTKEIQLTERLNQNDN